MMWAFFTVAEFALAVNLAAANVCISPSFPGPSTCGECPSSSLQGQQCVRENGSRWMACYTSYEACCKDPEVRNHSTSPEDCVAKSSGGSDGNSGSGGGSSPEVPKVDDDFCKQVSSTNLDKDNKFCMELCDSLLKSGVTSVESDKEFSANCVWSHWHSTNGRSVVDGPCFEKWIYGYSEPANLASFSQNLVTDTPAQCQLLCQEDKDCINWSWVTELYASTGADIPHRCSLKNRKMVEIPLGIVTETSNPSNMDVGFCNYGLPLLCSINHYACLKCEGQKRCVWESDMHISGWKHCVSHDGCDPFPEPEIVTTEPPATKPKATEDATTKPPATKPKATEGAITTKRPEEDSTRSPTKPPVPDKTTPPEIKPTTTKAPEPEVTEPKTVEVSTPGPDEVTKIPPPVETSPEIVGPNTDECHPETTECEPDPKPPCHCHHHHHHCSCRDGQLVLRVGQRPKRLKIELEN